MRQYWLRSNIHDLHAEIAAEVTELIDSKGMEIGKAANRVIKNHMGDLEEHWDVGNDSDDDDSD